MSENYPRRPTGESFFPLVAHVSEPIAQGAATTVRVRNRTGYTMTIVGVQGFCTALSNGGATLDIQNLAGVSHLALPVTLVAGAVAESNAITGAAGTGVINGVDVYFVFTNNGGAGNLTDGQGTVTTRVLHATT